VSLSRFSSTPFDLVSLSFQNIFARGRPPFPSSFIRQAHAFPDVHTVILPASLRYRLLSEIRVAVYPILCPVFVRWLNTPAEFLFLPLPKICPCGKKRSFSKDLQGLCRYLSSGCFHLRGGPLMDGGAGSGDCTDAIRDSFVLIPRTPFYRSRSARPYWQERSGRCWIRNESWIYAPPPAGYGIHLFRDTAGRLWHNKMQILVAPVKPCTPDAAVKASSRSSRLMGLQDRCGKRTEAHNVR